MYQIVATDGRAKSAHMETVHGVIETPVFMNVGTIAAIKGAVATTDLKEIGTQVELSNTYHLHVRPGDQIVKTAWRPAQVYELGQTDSYGFRRLSGILSERTPQRSRKRAFISSHILMVIRFLWGRRRVCRFSRTLVQL